MHKIMNEENIRRQPNDKLNVHTIMILLQIKEEVQCWTEFYMTLDKSRNANIFENICFFTQHCNIFMIFLKIFSPESLACDEWVTAISSICEWLTTRTACLQWNTLSDNVAALDDARTLSGKDVWGGTKSWFLAWHLEHSSTYRYLNCQLLFFWCLLFFCDVRIPRVRFWFSSSAPTSRLCMSITFAITCRGPTSRQ